MNMENILKINNLTVKYGTTIAVENVSLSLSQGNFLLVVGRNGSGKSTLMKAILSLVEKSEGNVEFFSDIQKKIGYLPQMSDIQKGFPATVWEIVLTGFVGKKRGISFYNARERRKAREIIDYLGIEALKNKSFCELSGGEKQKVLLARALASASYCIPCQERNCHCHEETFCHTNGLIVLDEPSNGLDPESNRNLYEMLDRLRQEKGMTVIMVSHLVDSAICYADKILHMDTKPLFFGSREEYEKSDLGMRFLDIKRGGGANE